MLRMNESKIQRGKIMPTKVFFASERPAPLVSEEPLLHVGRSRWRSRGVCVCELLGNGSGGTWGLPAPKGVPLGFRPRSRNRSRFLVVARFTECFKTQYNLEVFGVARFTEREEIPRYFLPFCESRHPENLQIVLCFKAFCESRHHQKSAPVSAPRPEA